ncbi:MAG TPA: ABC transporter ATP-binding protein [Solirubrobacteraceae bacterium]|nr:ABC transporter ATP-binding protein [Solirubrobacteraceae bacterium]
MTAIVAEKLSKRFGQFTAVDDVSFEVPEGQVLAVLGPNGAGKTTTLEMLEGFMVPSRGTVRVLGADPRRAGRAWRARIGLVLQSTSLDAEVTVRELLAQFGRLYPNPWPIADALKMVDLADDADVRVGVLSGGQRRRTDLAVGIIGGPEVLFLDEPTTALDPEARRRTWAAIENLARTGTTVLLTTHYIDEADHLRYTLPPDAELDGLPASLAAHLDDRSRVLEVRSDDIAGALRGLIEWADRQRLDLTGIEVGPPSLEDAYLATIGQYAPREESHDE